MAGIVLHLTAALQLLTSAKRLGKLSESATQRDSQPRTGLTLALGTVRVSAGKVAVSYALPVTVPRELHQAGSEAVQHATVSASIAEASAEVNVKEGSADYSVSGLRLTHTENNLAGAPMAAAVATSAGAAQTGADFARHAWQTRDVVTEQPASSLAETAPHSPLPQGQGDDLLQMRFATVLLRRTKRLVWAAGSASTEFMDGGKLAFDLCAVDPRLNFSTDAAFTLLAMGLEMTAAVTSAKLQPLQPLALAPAAQLPEEVGKAATAAVASASDTMERVQREGRLRGRVRVLGARVQLPLNDGYTFSATVCQTDWL